MKERIGGRGPVGKKVSSAGGWDDLAAVRLLTPDQVESCSLRGGDLRRQSRDSRRKGVYCVYDRSNYRYGEEWRVLYAKDARRRRHMGKGQRPSRKLPRVRQDRALTSTSTTESVS